LLFDEIVRRLEEGRPVILLTVLSISFYRPTPEAVVHPANGEIPEPQRRHAIIGVGHGTVDGNRAVLVRNSWGPSWGDKGYAWITEPFLNSRLFAAAILTENIDVPSGSAAA
jgi:hypothetical protein